MTLVGQFDGMLLLIDHEVQRISNFRHLALIVLDIEVFGFLHQLLHARLTQELDERLIFRKSLMATEQKFCSFILLPVSNRLLGLIQSLGNKRLLAGIQFLDVRSENLVLLVILSLRYRT